MGQRWSLRTQEEQDNFNDYVNQCRLAGKALTVEFVDKDITPKQFNALHVWFRKCALVLREAGIDMRAIMAKRVVEVPVTETSFKEDCYKPLLEIMQGKKSTKDQDTTDCPEVREVLHRHFAEKHNVQLPAWPDKFNQGYSLVHPSEQRFAE